MNEVEDVLTQLQRALVAELVDDILLNFGQFSIRQDVMEVKDLPQRLKRFERGILERLISTAAKRRVEIGDAFFLELADAGFTHLPIVLADLAAAFQLPLDA